MKKTIPPALNAWVMARSGEGKSGEEIAELLWREHKVETTGRSVRALVRKHGQERAEIAKSVVRDELRRHLLPAIQGLARTRVRAVQTAARARARAVAEAARNVAADAREIREEEMLALKAEDRANRATNLMLHYAGLNQPDQPGQGDGAPLNKNARDLLLGKVLRLAQAQLPGAPKEPPVH